MFATFVAALMLAGAVSAAGIQHPAFAADGDLIIGWMWTSPDELLADPDLNECRSLVSFRPDGSELTRIVDCNGNDESITSVQNIAVSPDGTRIAFTGQTTGRQALFVVGVDGEGLEEFCITDVTCEATPDPFDSWGVQVSWESNDLLYFFFHNPSQRVLIVSPEDGIVADIDFTATSALGIRLSPDGSSLIFHDYADVYVAPADDIEDFELLASCEWPCHPVWHPSGEGVIYTKRSGSENYAVSFAAVDPLADPFDYVLQTGHDTDGPNYPSQGPHSLAISPDGTHLIFGSWRNSGIYVVAIQSGEVLAVEDLDPIFTPFWTSHGRDPRPSAGGFHWVGPAASPMNPRDPNPTVSVSCGPLPLGVGATVTCTVIGGDPGIDILWRASYNPTFASAGVTLDADGMGSFSFTVPPEARGQEVMVELVEWAAPMALGVAGGPVPSRIPAGEGRDGLPAGLLAATGLVLAVGVAVRRRSPLTVG